MHLGVKEAGRKGHVVCMHAIRNANAQPHTSTRQPPAPEQLADVRPEVAPNVPAGHRLHTPEAARLYVPTPHTDAVALVLPATHAYPPVQLPLHADDVSPLTAPYVPAGHSPLHAAVDKPAVAPCDPTLQFVHAPAAARLYVPTGHIAPAALMDPATQKYPAVQLPLHAALVRPAVAP